MPIDAPRLAGLPLAYHRTRDGLRAIACYAVAPARKALDGHISLTPTGDGDGFGTPDLPDGTRLLLRGVTLCREPGEARTVPHSVREAAVFCGVEPNEDPGVGHDLPPFEPDAPLDLDETAAVALGDWYAFVAGVLAGVRTEMGHDGTMTEARLWPEHFDLACDWGRDDEHRINLGGSPGDTSYPDPYLYAGPWERDGLAGDDFWNAPFGAVLSYDALVAAGDEAVPAGVAFLREAMRRLG